MSARPDLGIQVSRRLVRQDHLRLSGQRPGDGNTLLLPAGKLIGPATGQMGDTQRLQGLHRFCLSPALGHASKFQKYAAFSNAVRTGIRLYA